MELQLIIKSDNVLYGCGRDTTFSHVLFHSFREEQQNLPVSERVRVGYQTPAEQAEHKLAEIWCVQIIMATCDILASDWRTRDSGRTHCRFRWKTRMWAAAGRCFRRGCRGEPARSAAAPAAVWRSGRGRSWNMWRPSGSAALSAGQCSSARCSAPARGWWRRWWTGGSLIPGWTKRKTHTDACFSFSNKKHRNDDRFSFCSVTSHTESVFPPLDDDVKVSQKNLHIYRQPRIQEQHVKPRTLIPTCWKPKHTSQN